MASGRETDMLEIDKAAHANFFADGIHLLVRSEAVEGSEKPGARIRRSLKASP
jgi:hypothetical protein